MIQIHLATRTKWNTIPIRSRFMFTFIFASLQSKGLPGHTGGLDMTPVICQEDMSMDMSKANSLGSPLLQTPRPLGSHSFRLHRLRGFGRCAGWRAVAAELSEAQLEPLLRSTWFLREAKDTKTSAGVCGLGGVEDERGRNWERAFSVHRPPL